MYNTTTEQNTDFRNELIMEMRFLQTLAKKFGKEVIEPDDLVQDTLVKAMTYAEKYKQGTNLKGWLSVMMRNIYINNYRKFYLYQKFSERSNSNGSFSPPIDTDLNQPDELLLAANIKTALTNLKTTESAPFQLFASGYKYREIADRLMIPIGTVKTRIYLAKRNLKTMLKSCRS